MIEKTEKDVKTESLKALPSPPVRKGHTMARS